MRTLKTYVFVACLCFSMSLWSQETTSEEAASAAETTESAESAKAEASSGKKKKKDMSPEELVPQELLLSTLNSVGHMKLESDQINQLVEYNKGFVDKIYDILNADKEDKRKKEQLDALAYTREKDLRDFMSKSETRRYLKEMEDQLKPLVHRNKMLKNIAK